MKKNKSVPITADQVRHMAALAKLNLDDATVEKFRRQLQSILDYVAMLDTLDVDRTPPTASTQEERPSLRADEITPCLPPEEALVNAPDAAENHFRIPQVIKG